MSYAIRLSYRYLDLASFLEDLKTETDVLVVYEHDDGNRPHVHIYTEGLKQSVLTVKNRLARYLGFRPAKTDWSFKTAENRKFITYMSKGTLQPKTCKGIDGTELEGLRSQWIERRQPNTEKEVKSTVSTWSMAKELAEFMDNQARCEEVKVRTHENGLRITHTRHEWYEVSPECMIQECIEIHKRHEKSFCDFSLIRVIQTAYGLSTREHWNKQIVNTVYAKLFPINKA